MATNATDTANRMSSDSPEPGETQKAGALIRLAAGLIDLVVMGIPALLLVSIFMDVTANPDATPLESLFSTANLLQGFIILIVTVLMLVNWDGRTPGKKILNLRIVSYPGNGELSYYVATLRSLLSLTGAFTIGLGYLVMGIMIATRADRRGYHDILAGTCVIRER
ncbi:MAG: RDD family protein [SAR202 cluster bacterium]|nr:RDD family protein [SAR202 cluster bacterium]